MSNPFQKILQRYEIFYRDLTDDKRPWRHDPNKLSVALMDIYSVSKKL